MHEIAHTQQKVGLASAMAIVLLLIIIVATVLQKLFFKFVFKSADDEDKYAGIKRDRRIAKYVARRNKREARKGGLA